MKKVYVKPEAMNVAFAVNENIATSGAPNESLNGSVTYVNAVKGVCNEVLNSTNIETGLIEGCYNIEHVIRNLQNRVESGEVTGSALQDLWDTLQVLKNNPDSFVCTG